MIRRREFIALLGGAASWPLSARAQQQSAPTVGFLHPGVPETNVQRVEAFRKGLSETGYIEGRNVRIEFGWARDDGTRLAELAADLVRRRVAVIFASGGIGALAAKAATPSIPIVFATGGDAVQIGLVASLSRPGGNVTGLSNQNRDVAGKRVELLREIVPGLRGLGILFNADNTATLLESRDVDEAARTFGLEVIPLKIRRVGDIAPALETLQGPARSLYVAADPLVNSNALRINTLALVKR